MSWEIKGFFLLINLAFSLGAFADPLPILQEKSTRPGFCVVLGAKDAESLAAYALEGKYLVQGVVAEAKIAEGIKNALAEKDVYGKVSVISLNGRSLPYIDNLANVIVVANQGEVSREEIMRVLAPYGVALFKEGSNWKKVSKAYPKEMDEWTQYRHDVVHSTVSRDQLVGPPTRLQWLDQEEFDREDLMRLLSAGGRNFYIFGRGKIVARDAFNGTRLWVQNGTGRFWVATKDSLITAVGGKLAILDAATGDISKKDVRFAGSCSYDQGVLYTANGAYHIKQEKFLWQNPEPKGVGGAPLVADGKLIFTTNPRHAKVAEIICRDAKTGQDLWRIPTQGQPATCYRGKLLTREKPKSEKVKIGKKLQHKEKARNHCFDLKTGQHLWTIEFYLPGHHGSSVMFCIGDEVWVRPGKKEGRTGRDEYWQSYDLQTGKPVKRIDALAAMHRCYEARATDNFILGSGMDFLDLKTGKTYFFHGARGDCGLGNTPANGMLYQFPNMCLCMAQVDGVSGVKMHSLADPGEKQLKLSSKLEKGPAFGKIKITELANHNEWPALRCNNSRLGSNQSKLPAKLKQLWQQPLGVKSSSPVAAGGAVYVVLRDKHAVAAYSASDGKAQWVFTADGPVNSPPTLAGNAVVFGSEDGWVYVLRVDDGKLAWRFRAAPAERILLSNGHAASAWPVHGSVLVDQGIVYAVAGHHNELDGGLFAYALELDTGKIAWQKRIVRDGTAEGIKFAEAGNTGNNILAGDTENLYLELLQLDKKTGGIKKSTMGKTLYTGGWPTTVVWGGPHGYLIDNSQPSYTSGHSSSDWTWGNVRANMLAVDEQYGYGIITLHGKSIKHRKKEPLFQASPTAVFCSKQAKSKKGWPDYFPKDSLVWKYNLPEKSVARSIIKTSDQVIIACLIDGAEGRNGGLILQLDPASGQEKGRVKIPAPPRWDGLAAAGDKLFVVTEDGRLIAFGN